MTTYISKELAQWLKERGCKIKADKFWEVPNEEERKKFLDGQLVDAEFDEGWFYYYPAYSWFDLLVTHAKEFWGEGPESIAETEAFKWWPMLLVSMLQEERYVAAENLVRKHSLFAKQTKND